MRDFSVLIGGKAGEGLNKAGQIIAHLLGSLGYNVYMYYDYPSLIRGGHNFSIIRASDAKIATHRENVDVILALNQDAINLHKTKVRQGGTIIYDSNYVKDVITDGVGIPFLTIIKEENAPAITRNSGIIGAFSKAVGIEWSVLERVIARDIPRGTEVNLKIAKRGFDAAKPMIKLDPLDKQSYPFLTGNEAIALGLIRGGLATYIAYPMTPSSSILHFMAEVATQFGLKVIHPENEIAVMLMALGCAAAGDRVAVGTSGGGFCLMTEGLSLAGMAEVPVVIVMGQRTGPSTGLPTYTGQTEFDFVRHAGQGEFPRFIVAPGDAEEAVYWAGVALNIAWKFQIPAFVLSDKTLSEGGFSFDYNIVNEIKDEGYVSWDRNPPYNRYQLTEDGVSPFAVMPDEEAIIKFNSYYHDERGISTEEATTVATMQEKFIRKRALLENELNNYNLVNVFGDEQSHDVIFCWGSNKGVCTEVGNLLGLKVVQPIVLWPFPIDQCKKALSGARRIICVENNVNSQVANLAIQHGCPIDTNINKYDGRPFTVEELEQRLRGVLQ